MEANQFVEQYKDHRIDLTPQWVFEASGEAFQAEMPRRFPSLKDARSAIDDAVAVYVKQRKAQAVISLPALTFIGFTLQVLAASVLGAIVIAMMLGEVNWLRFVNW